MSDRRPAVTQLSLRNAPEELVEGARKLVGEASLPVVQRSRTIEPARPPKQLYSVPAGTQLGLEREEVCERIGAAIMKAMQQHNLHGETSVIGAE